MKRGVLCLILVALLTRAYAQLPCALIMPSILRLETRETIIVDAQLQSTQFDAEIIIQDFPLKSQELVKGKVSLNSANGFLGKVDMKIPGNDLFKDTNKKHYVNVVVRSKECALQKVVRLSFHSGYIFIQTDKPIYNPGTLVKYRLFVTGHSLEPDARIVDVEFVNPDGIVVKKERFSSGEHVGIVEKTFNIPEITNDGIWNITCKFQVAPQDVFFTEFEVKEYVLPSFEVFLDTPQNHFYVDENDFTVTITANYLHGKPVEGFGLVMFGVILNNEKKIFPDSLTNITLNKGKADVKLERYMIPRPFLLDPSFLLGKSLYVSVTVVTSAGSDKVEAVKTGIPVVNTAFNVLFTKTSKHFKPSMPYLLKLLLQNPNGSPAPNVELCTLDNACSKTTADGTTGIIINTKPEDQEMKILVRTKAVGIPDKRQTVGSLTVTAYKPQGGSENYLHIGLTETNINVGDNLQVQFYTKNKILAVQRSITHIIYMIISRGRVIKLERVQRQPDQTVIATSIVITGEYIPSFRMLAYYVVPGNQKEIVSDSVWVDTADSCIRQLELSEDPKKITLNPQPGTPVSLKLTGEPGASVGMVAVDKAVFVLNKKNRMTQNKVWNGVQRSDLGCTPGGGTDSAGVFVDAGLAVESNLGLASPTRNELHCEESPRRRRSVTIASRKTEKAQEYSDPNLRKCCEDGMKENIMGYSCQRRSQYILELGECVQVFLLCCKHIFEPVVIRGRPKLTSSKRPSIFRPGSTIGDTGKADALNEDDYATMDTILSRSLFYESWLWKIEKLPTKADSRGYASKTLNANLPDSVTTWEFLAISLSPNSGICVSKPFEMLVRKSFFIDLRLPYSVVRNEQVEIRAVLHSYIDQEIEAVVDLIYNKEMCSAATGEADFRQVVKLEPTGTLILPFVIVPLKTGDIRIEVKASVKHIFHTDGVVKNLKVVPEGLRILKSIQSVILDPLRSADTPGTQVLTINTSPPTDIVPNTEANTYISVQGSLLGETLQNSIDGANLKHLITVPSGCGEQIMMSMTPTVIATRFLDVTNQWERIGVERRAEAIKNIEQGYIQQMTYRKPDNSYSAFTNRPASTWLTAYVVKVFAMAGRMMNIEKDILCGAMKWLLSEKQLPIGTFKEDAPVIHGEMVGGTGNTDPDASLTAFVLIALVEAKSFCENTIPDLQSKLDKSSTYLEGRLKTLKNPYSICITSYALSLVGKLPDHQQLIKSSTGGTHWADYSSDLYMIEASSYGLLALLKLKQYLLAEPVAKWLTEQRFYGGGYGSTQATIMVFQALSEFQIHSPEMNEIDMDVTMSLPGRSGSFTWKLHTENALVQRSEKAEMKDKIIVTAKGKGQGTLTVMSLYYVPLAEGVAPCKNFEFSVTLEDVPKNVKVPIDVKKSMFINICMKYLGATDATMTIVDLTLLTGFNPDMDDLSALTNRVDKYISKYEMDTERSERGSLIIYLDSVSRTETQCLKFKIHQKFEVGILQPATVSIYEYYALENICTKFYHPTEEGGELKKICREAECHCISEQCNLKNTYSGKLDAVSMVEEACRHGVDYVYEAKVNKIETKGAYDVHFMTIVRVVKQGSDEVLDGEERQFFSHKSCRDSQVKLQDGRSYLIWGHSNDIWDIKKEKSYVINGRTWFEIIPTKRECATTEQAKCDQLYDFMDHLMMRGCNQ
ncbi:PREDICTED: complement C3-like [Nanorana parkeri]|uniref:complement C3-like n=1 Tax=Nanorana parkeri TaxID=125878 RepID=UPI00085416D0|nr:PREDICTED: complement C3-like [Nanorana parkeri]